MILRYDDTTVRCVSICQNCQNRRKPRRFVGARPSWPQRVPDERARRKSKLLDRSNPLRPGWARSAASPSTRAMDFPITITVGTCCGRGPSAVRFMERDPSIPLNTHFSGPDSFSRDRPSFLSGSIFKLSPMAPSFSSLMSPTTLISTVSRLSCTVMTRPSTASSPRVFR